MARDFGCQNWDPLSLADVSTVTANTVHMLKDSNSDNEKLIHSKSGKIKDQAVCLLFKH